MPIRYAGDSYNRAAGTRDAFAALSVDLEREGYPAIFVNDGDREPQDEIDLFLSRFRPQATGNGAYNDVRYWNGVRYVRFSPLGTVAVPLTSNHGKRRANDLGYPYNSDTAAHRRAQVLAKRHNITCEGMGFREWWHWTYWGPLGVIAIPASGGSSAPATPAVPTPESEEDAMKILLMHIKLANGTDPWFVVDYAAGTAARMREGIQLDIAREYGRIVEVAGVQPESAIRGLRIVNG